MKAKNLVFIISDEHQARALSCAGHPIVERRTSTRLPNVAPALIRPIRRVRSACRRRASLATGRYVHEIRYWDNATAYDGRVPGWGVRLQASNVRVESIGKLHYRNGTIPTGFDAQHLPMHIWKGIGQVWGSVRDPMPAPRDDIVRFDQVGAGYSKYNAYDEAVRDQAIAWLRNHGATIVPGCCSSGLWRRISRSSRRNRYIDQYPPDEMPLPKLRQRNGYARHPWVEAQELFPPTDVEFGTDDASAAARSRPTTRCARWSMSTSERSADCSTVWASRKRPPSSTRPIMAKRLDCVTIGASQSVQRVHASAACHGGAGRAPWASLQTAVNLIDLAPTFLAAFGLSDPALPGRSLFDIAREPL